MNYKLASLWLVAGLMLTGCSDMNNTKNENTIYSETIFHKGLASVFPENISKNQILYQGMSEYGHVQVLNNVYEASGNRYVHYVGWMEDGVGGEKEERTFEIEYEITEEQIIERIKNEDIYHPDRINRLKSIIPNQVVLQAPLEVNHSWLQEFEYKPFKSTETTGESLLRTATHKIEKITQNNGKFEFIVKTSVTNMDGYYNNTYWELKTWTVGEGLTSFVQAIPEFEGFKGDVQNAELLSFGYGKVLNQ